MCHMTIDYEDCSRFIKEKLHIDIFPYQEIMLKAFCDDLEVRTGRAIGRSFVADALANMLRRCIASITGMSSQIFAFRSRRR